ncbi:hypothetical protein [Capnocytophaga canis]|uniref:hypothetical protein n=1 Tax=Capnocytophaga canis TaxID=1848903 RepID=UPI0037D0DC6D
MKNSETFNHSNVKQNLVDKLKIYHNQCLDIIEKTIDTNISDDKLYNVLKSKRQAVEDATWTADEIERLERELRGEPPKEVEKKESENFAERMAKKSR